MEKHYIKNSLFWQCDACQVFGKGEKSFLRHSESVCLARLRARLSRFGKEMFKIDDILKGA